MKTNCTKAGATRKISNMVIVLIVSSWTSALPFPLPAALWTVKSQAQLVSYVAVKGREIGKREQRASGRRDASRYPYARARNVRGMGNENSAMWYAYISDTISIELSLSFEAYEWPDRYHKEGVNANFGSFIDGLWPDR